MDEDTFEIQLQRFRDSIQEASNKMEYNFFLLNELARFCPKGLS